MAIPGALAFPINPPSLGQFFRSTPIEYVVMAQVPYPELQRIVDRFLDEVRKYPGIQNLQIDLRLNTPEVRVTINRDKLSDIGIPVETVGRTLETMLGGRQVTRFKREGEQYDVIVQVDAGRPVDAGRHQRRLRARPRRRHGATVQSRHRQGRGRAAVAQPLQSAPRRQDLWHAAARLLDQGGAGRDGRRGEGRAAPTALTDLDNQSREFRNSKNEIYLTFVLALIFIYLVLAAQFESFVAPVRDHAVRAAVDDGRALHAVAHRRDAQHLQPGRAHHAGRPHHQARHPDRRVRQPAARERRGTATTR